ncbi:MAG: CoA transferase, partial [Chloroflexota bacterium]|nr:CoA transferase [Chloroflexota bacterium]
GMAQDAGDLADCPHLEARDFFVKVDHPVAGSARYPGMAVRLPGETMTASQPAPLLGQHNAEIFGEELGYSTKDIISLRQQGVI